MIINYLPPPNVTGRLHIGHALNITLQDVYLRYQQVLGHDTTWVPGTDHAGIATQLVANRKYPNATLEQIWEVKQEHERLIIEQVKLMHTVIDWDQYKFTLDEQHSSQVKSAFTTLFKQGLIYRAKRITYWDTKMQSACSDLEVNFQQQTGEFFYLRYALESDTSKCTASAESDRLASAVSNAAKHIASPEQHIASTESDTSVYTAPVASAPASTAYITVATTRPETIFADCALVVHPDDVRYQHLIGKSARIPIIDKTIPIIADHRVESDKGTGVLKITPAHDFLDYQIAHDHELLNPAPISVIDKYGNMTNVPDDFMSLSVTEARAQFHQSKLEHIVEKVEKITHNVPISDKTQTILEVLLTDQWFVDTQSMAVKALAAVDSGDLEILPAVLINEYRSWLTNIQPWCISRQIIWGHRIPIYYNQKNGTPMLEEMLTPDMMTTVTPETDVLDTWFSSALWIDYAQILVTGKDILFFWVARMVMMNLHLYNKLPFDKVVLHGLVLDKQGKKMSKMFGNVIDPLEIITQFGVDALRLSLMTDMYLGKNIRFDMANLERSRNLLTKLSNARKFLANQYANSASNNASPNSNQTLVHGPTAVIDQALANSWNAWIVARTHDAQKQYHVHMQAFEFAKALHIVWQLVYDHVCSTYIEVIKYIPGCAQYLEYALDCIELMLYPFAPEHMERKVVKHEVAESVSEQSTKLAELQCLFIKDARSLRVFNAIEYQVDQYAEFLSKLTRLPFTSRTDGYKFNKFRIKFDIAPVAKLETAIQEHTILANRIQAMLHDEQFLTRAEEHTVLEKREQLAYHYEQIAHKQALLDDMR